MNAYAKWTNAFSVETSPDYIDKSFCSRYNKRMFFTQKYDWGCDKCLFVKWEQTAVYLFGRAVD